MSMQHPARKACVSFVRICPAVSCRKKGLLCGRADTAEIKSVVARLAKIRCLPAETLNDFSRNKGGRQWEMLAL